MAHLLLVPESVPLLCQLLMAGYGAVYVATVRRKTRATRWMLGVLTGLTLYAASYFLSTTLAYESDGPARVSVFIYLAVLGAAVALVGFAYTFGARPYRREGHVVTALWGAAWLVMAVWGGVTAASPALTFNGPLFRAFSPLLVWATVWALVTFVRQGRRLHRLARAGDVRASRRRAVGRAHYTFAGLAAVLLGMAVINALATRDLVPFGMFQYVVLSAALALVFGLFTAFLNYAPERTTLQAKLVGLGLATVLLVLGVAGLQLLRPDEFAVEAENWVLPQALRFTPDGAGGYTVQSAPVTLVDSVGQRLPGAGSALPLPFRFPFAGASYPTAYFATCMAVAFRPFDSAPETRLPRIAAVLRPCYGGGPAARYARLARDRVTVTWVNEEIGGGRGRSQLTLYRDGRFDVAYSGPRLAAIAGGVGFSPGGRAREVDFDPAAPRGARVGAGAGLWRDYTDRYRAYAHHRTLPLVRLVFASAGFVLLFFPLFLRTGLLLPLATLSTGVRRLDAGDLSVRIPTSANDELGALARSFNGMAASVRATQHALWAYANTLESRVAERTEALEEKGRALEQSLDELRAAQTRLVQAEKLASLGRLTSGIAHEIKNPLNFVNNFAGLQVELAEELAHALHADDAEAQELLADLRLNAEKIREHGARADGIVRAMQLHARTEGVERHEVELAPLLEVAADAAERGFAQRHPTVPAGPIARRLDADLGRVVVAPEAVTQVVVSLLDNALDAVRRAGGGQAAGDGAPGQEAPVTLRASRTDGVVTICVQDHGPGMDEATRTRAFEPFFTTKPPGEGTGLGLSLAYDIVVDGHGGSLTADSAPGHGCTFTVTLPVG